MRKYLTLALAVLCLAALTCYALWTSQRPVGHYLSDLRIQVDAEQGHHGDRGNLLGIQPELFVADYQSVQRLHLKLAGYLRQAREHGLINSRTIVVLPEHIGTWLWAVGEKPEFYQVRQRKEAEQWLTLSNPLQWAGALAGAEGSDRLSDAYLRSKARSMAQQYQQLFSGLAKEFGVTLVAGSIVLPEPSVTEGQLQVGNGALYNVSLVFGSDGSPLGQPQRQRFISHATRRYVEAGGEGPMNVIDTPAGRLAVLIGTDSWYPANYAQLHEQNAQLLAVPASVTGHGHWQRPWRGWRQDTPPAGVTLAPRQVSEAQAWQHLVGERAVTSITVFMAGRFWEQPNEGQSFAHHQGLSSQVHEGPGARLINVWL